MGAVVVFERRRRLQDWPGDRRESLDLVVAFGNGEGQLEFSSALQQGARRTTSEATQLQVQVLCIGTARAASD